MLTPETFVAAVQAAAHRFPEGPVFARSGVGRERWASVALDRGLAGHPQGIAMSLAGAGTTAATLIRDALGPAAITDGRLQKVERRDEALWIIATAIADGFSFEPGWTVRIQEFGRTTRYSFNWMGLRGWANRLANGDLRSLIEEAQQLASDTPRNPE